MSMKKALAPAPDAGFSLIELVVTLAVTSMILAGALTAFVDADRMNRLSAETVNLNRDLATAVDFIVRDLTQVGQGLPNTKVLTIPSGDNVALRRPGPPGSNLQLADDATAWPAVLTGPALGPRVAPTGPLTDLLTVVLADVNFTTPTGEPLTCTVASNGASMTINNPPVSLETGDILMFEVSGQNAVQVVTSVAGTTTQTAQFASGDRFGFNRRTAPDGTILQIRPGTTSFAADVTRIRIVTYYIDERRNPPALMRCVNSQCVGTNPLPGQAVALGIQNFQISFDLVDGATNPANVRMTPADLAGGGACGAQPCNEGQIRKVNVFLAMRSRHRFKNEFVHRSLSTQVSLRNLSFLDRYPTS
jgi:prepilin-type N-terminal cleavage/methylation domain-containing protein